MAEKTERRVHLDHLLPKQSLRYIKLEDQSIASLRRKEVLPSQLAYKDIEEATNTFPWLHKPDFQRQTSAWKPGDCVDLIKSIVSGLIVPSLILWRSEDTGLVYILDGAHRVSVVRAWMLDDWGDKAPPDYYERYDTFGEVQDAAAEARRSLNKEIGLFDTFRRAGEKFLNAAKANALATLSNEERQRGAFYADIKMGVGFHIQWVVGSYDVAEASFLRINKAGQRLDDLEITLIQHRNSSCARAVMAIANGGTGYFWPDEVKTDEAEGKLEELRTGCSGLHEKLFVPPLQTPIRDANVPFMVSPGYFQKEAYLLEFLPVIKGMSGTDEDAQMMLQRDEEASPAAILDNGLDLIRNAESAMAHLTGEPTENRTLAIVPLFYFYSTTGRYVRSAFYGFLSWINRGSDDQIRTRKIVFSAHRGRFEEVIFLRDILGAITRRVGSGGRATIATAEFFDKLLRVLDENPGETDEEPFEVLLRPVLEGIIDFRSYRAPKDIRTADNSQRTAVNMRLLFQNAIRCEICDVTVRRLVRRL